ncbi:conserved domain protein [Carboxydothermus hydrogenoformans Z-2901]|uniref:Conserved domain protein n=1 Tax=Carboxydothermus hydrogenoformans (strain ATCC BAA-161 / DSM 6008 / Z-2901) TaxID=246194 RepID=Q3ADQ2_CARHZ|nr:conserved domain protein [Carboxydothermus hydrogenoformans Z-2901]
MIAWHDSIGSNLLNVTVNLLEFKNEFNISCLRVLLVDKFTILKNLIVIITSMITFLNILCNFFKAKMLCILHWKS